MTFREFIMEDFGPLGSTEAGEWSNERKNGTEFYRKGIRSKYQIADGDLPREEKPHKTPEEVMGKNRLKKSVRKN